MRSPESKPGALSPFIQPCGTSWRATPRRLLARGCHDNRQTDANETPSPSISQRLQVFYWPLRCPVPAPLRGPMLFSRLSCSLVRWHAAAICSGRGLLAALTGCRSLALRRMRMLQTAASRPHGRPPVQRCGAVPKSGRGREISGPSVRSCSRLAHWRLTHRRQSIPDYAALERRQELPTGLDQKTRATKRRRLRR